jgi:hypothetical protein
VPPGVDERLPEAGECAEKAGDEDGAAAAEPLVVRRGEPATDEGTADVRRRVEKTGEPSGASIFAADAELRGVEELSAVDDSLV